MQTSPLLHEIESRRLAARLSFRDLQLLVALDSGYSLRRAAQLLSVTQPAVTRTLQQVEGAFGHVLFHRSPKGLEPTAEGAVAMRGARQLLAELGRVQKEVDLGSRAAAVIRLGVPHFVAYSMLPGLVSTLQEGGKAVHVHLMEAPVKELQAALDRGDLDALITTYIASTHEPNAVRLKYEKLFMSNYVPICHPDHPAARQKKPDLNNLLDSSWVLPSYTSILRRDIDDAFQRSGLTPPRPTIESNNPFTNIHLVASGHGLAFVPHATLSGMQAEIVKVLRISIEIPSRPVALIYRAGSVQNQVELLRKALESMGYYS
ncbi:MAG: LysR family transcriptional regulator [Burkholderiaceae bacterium]|nr:LysR family transcriptional regulator [Burkholderiaceae bacterium]